MGLEKIAETFKNSSVKALAPLGLAFALSAPLAANAADGQCASLVKDEQGYKWGASYSAHDYSEKNPGKVGISIYPGSDLAKNNFTADQVGKFLVASLKKRGVDAECFVNDSMFSGNGTSIGFKIRGLSIKVDGDDSFNMGQVWNDPRIMDFTEAEAKLVRAVYGDDK